jgi:hypothetical protein
MEKKLEFVIRDFDGEVSLDIRFVGLVNEIFEGELSRFEDYGWWVAWSYSCGFLLIGLQR